MSPKDIYTEHIKTLTDEIYQLNRHNRLVVVLELTAIALAIGCIVAYTIWSSIVALVVAALFIAAYVVIRWKDSSNSRLSEQKESIRSVYQKEVAYLNGDFSGFPSGEQYVNPHHEFTLDMLTVEVAPHGPVGQKQDKMRSMLMPLLYMYILTIINVCNIIVTRIAYNHSWQYAYYLEIGLLLAGMLVVLLTMKDEPKKEPFLMDWRRLLDMLLLGTSLVSLCYVMAYGKTLDWLSSRSIVLAIGICLISAGLFLLLQIARKNEAYLPLGIFRYRNVRIAALLFILFVVMNASSVFTTTYAHLASPASDMQIGAQSRWPIVGYLLGAVLAVGMVLRRVPLRIVFLLSFVLMGASNVLMYFLFQNEILLSQLALPIVLMNIGLLPLYALVAAYGMKGLPNRLLASLLFIMILTRNAIAPPIGSALYSNWFYERQQYHEQRLSEHADALTIGSPSQLVSTRHTILIQSNLAAMKDITGNTVWLFLAISIVVAALPARKKSIHQITNNNG